jgi:hypothetical protein
MLGVQLWPEGFREDFAWMRPTFHSQVDKQGQRLARGESECRFTVFYYRDAKQRQL